MIFKFSDITGKELYEKSSVAFVLGKYDIFINMVADKFKGLCVDSSSGEAVKDLVGSEFGLSSDEGSTSTSVDFNTFMNVSSIPNINGKWYCKVELNSLNKKQKEKMLRYIKSPSKNGILVLVSNDWQVYREYLNNRVIKSSSQIGLVQLTYPYRDTLIEIVKELFGAEGMKISVDATEVFITKMSKAYDEYESVIKGIKEQHTSDEMINIAQLREYMRGIEYFDIDDFLCEVIKPLSSEVVTGRKRIVKVMAVLADELGAKKLVYTMLSKVNEMIEYRININNGIIPIGVRYFFGDVIKELGSKYEKVNEWVFRKKADLASQTSLRDWEYMQLILKSALEDKMLSESEAEMRCKKALYELCTRSVLTESRINNIIGAENVLDYDINELNKIKYTEEM